MVFSLFLRLPRDIKKLIYWMAFEPTPLARIVTAARRLYGQNPYNFLLNNSRTLTWGCDKDYIQYLIKHCRLLIGPAEASNYRDMPYINSRGQEHIWHMTEALRHMIVTMLRESRHIFPHHLNAALLRASEAS